MQIVKHELKYGNCDLLITVNGAYRAQNEIIGTLSVKLKYYSNRSFQNEMQLLTIMDTTILIRGESGVGKELVAKAIHDQSARSKMKMIKINCEA